MSATYKPSIHAEQVREELRQRHSQRSWKEHRKTRYRRLAGLTHKQAMRILDHLLELYVSMENKKARRQ